MPSDLDQILKKIESLGTELTDHRDESALGQRAIIERFGLFEQRTDIKLDAVSFQLSGHGDDIKSAQKAAVTNQTNIKNLTNHVTELFSKNEKVALKLASVQTSGGATNPQAPTIDGDWSSDPFVRKGAVVLAILFTVGLFALLGVNLKEEIPAMPTTITGGE